MRKIFESKLQEIIRGLKTCYNEEFVSLLPTKYYTGDAAN